MSSPVTVSLSQIESLAKLMSERKLGTSRIETMSYRGDNFLLVQIDDGFYLIDLDGSTRRFELVAGSPSGD